MKISYECSDLIKELKSDIAEFGNIEMYAFFEKRQNYTFLVDYDFIDDTMPLTPKEIGEAVVQIMYAKEILEILEEQNSII